MKGQATQTLKVKESEQRLYGTVQQEVDLGVSALSRKDSKMAIMLFQSALQKLSIRHSFHDHLVHNLLLSYKLQIEQDLDRGELHAAVSVLGSALKLEILGAMAQDIEFRTGFAIVFDSLGLIFFRHGKYDESLDCCRKAISIHPSPGFRINLENALRASGQRALLTDFTTDHTNEQFGRHIFIACVPKSGSTFLKNALVSITGFRDAFMVYTPGQFEQDLYLPMLNSVASIDTVTQQHCRASDANVQMMQAFEIRPVALVRNIFDSVISLLDFYNGGAFTNSFFREDYSSLDERTRINLLIDNFVPWYFEFVASWSLIEKQSRLDLLWLSYEDLIINKPKAISDVLGFYGLGAPMRGIEQRINEIESEKRRTRFNKGIAGRGESGLSDTQKRRIRNYAKYYPSTDFSRIGL
jgi:sulfotransferase family protein